MDLDIQRNHVVSDAHPTARGRTQDAGDFRWESRQLALAGIDHRLASADSLFVES